LTEEARIGVDRLLGGETPERFDSGTWWSRLGGGFITPSMFWVPEWADPTPSAEHVPFAFWVVDALRPFAVVELTSRPGAFLAACCQAVDRLQLPTRCHAVAHRVNEAFTAHHDARYAQFSQLINLPADRVLSRVEDAGIDLLSIDLTAPGVPPRGLEDWLAKLSKRGVVLVHGISDAGIDGAARVFWEKLAETYPHFTFLHGAGLGVFGVGGDLPPALNQLFALHGVEPRALDVREMFARLGHGLRVQAELDELQRMVDAGGTAEQIARLEATLSATREALAAARVDHVKTLKRLRKVEESFWWRITKPMRRLVKNHRWAFYNMRQWIMCGFWIATLRFARLKKQMRPYRHARLVLKSGLMHEAWYLRQYPDVAAVGVPPSLHYVLYGGFEGRDPSPLFSSHAYLNAYPDVMAAKTNPLVHYLMKGRYENRAIQASTARPPAPKQSSAAPSALR
jgi:hypothetical protein